MIKAKSGGSTQREIIPSGMHIARCFQMIHVGTVEWEYMGEEKNTDKVRISFELPSEKRVFDESKGEQPLVIDKEYTLSMNEKANLRKDLESWRGKSFSEQEADDFDITKLLGVPCMLNIMHKENKKGNKYALIGSITPIPKGMECPAQINPNVEFNYTDGFNLEWLGNQPDFIKDMIKSTPEYKERVSELESHEEQKKRVVSEDLPF